ncbi:Bifunctional ligase/repressor BirA [Stieleria bergensis]|uniref:Bifunctional ligase/repressor BirA n=1 Tax=Stieleria bergensis TaxID=2528025 RepID=A0A517SZZ5_9BACT|nr:Bifunctional ligase/repressor BirA [Planctomycetes bacterium SV_7m_r]
MSALNPKIDQVGNVHQAMYQQIDQLLQHGLIASASYRSVTASTNSDAVADLQAFAQNAPTSWAEQPSLSAPSPVTLDEVLPRLYITDRQTGGRGRQGSSWDSSDDAVTFSLLIKLPSTPAIADLLSLAIGVAVARAIEFLCAPVRVKLKWPNDLCTLFGIDGSSVLQLCKLGGILIEANAAQLDCRVVGVGINLNEAPQIANPDALPALALAKLTGRALARHAAVAALIESTIEVLDELSEDPDSVLQQYRDRCALTGQQLSMQVGDQQIDGLCLGINHAGGLQLQTAGQVMSLRSGQVKKIRPQ